MQARIANKKQHIITIENMLLCSVNTNYITETNMITLISIQHSTAVQLDSRVEPDESTVELQMLRLVCHD